ncbi:hypothetical protein COV12_01720 [Candidatus Woesearchaeota archaeon CG10_big_fil_rev_8_21_14_0_10_32_24]|nr:MAG: hypothetical protein COV12_01720 [Candidatus Woesearchaeota archaeon CG10_big_fil_rev_8_21_14_0_10_32_24]
MSVVKKRFKRAELYNEIVETLKKEEKTILQIAKSFSPQLNWETSKNAVTMLQEVGIVSTKEQNGKTYYYVDESNIIDLDKDTLLGIHVTKEERLATLQLSQRIDLRWDLPRKLLKTFRNKIMIKVIKEAKIKNIPYGWYLFGECLLLQSDDLTGIKNIGSKYDKEIDSAIKYYSGCFTTNELMEKTYVDEHNETYLSRLKMIDFLLNKFTGDSINRLRLELRNLIFSFRKKEDNEDIIEFINGFAFCVFRMIKKMSLGELEEIRPLILETFTSMWEIIATYSLYESLAINGFYKKTDIKKYYSLRLESLKQVAEEYINNLKDHYPTLEIPDNDPILRFKSRQA